VGSQGLFFGWLWDLINAGWQRVIEVLSAIADFIPF
jgi:hypothetical protein